MKVTPGSKVNLANCLDEHAFPFHKLSGHGSVLTQLFWRCLVDNKISPLRYSDMVDKLVTELNQLEDISDQKHTSIRGNLIKAFSRYTMTWRTFCKALRLIRVSKFRIYLVAEYNNGERKSHNTDWITIAGHESTVELQQVAEEELDVIAEIGMTEFLESIKDNQMALHKVREFLAKCDKEKLK
jgi:hypothetical protein